VRHFSRKTHARAFVAVLGACLASLLLAACGGSSGGGSSSSASVAAATSTTVTPLPSSTTGTTGPSSTSTAKTPSPVPHAGHQKPPITPSLKPKPKPKPTAPPLSAAAVKAARTSLAQCMQSKGFTVPQSSGVPPAKYKAALQQCIPTVKVNVQALAHPPAGKSGGRSAASFVACMRRAGVKLPPQSKSGAINTAGVNTRTAKFTKAFASCQGSLPSISELVRESIRKGAGVPVPEG
jgi:hypothetical protein